MESTWERRDLPLLDAIVCYFDEHDGPEIPDVATFANLTGMEPSTPTGDRDLAGRERLGDGLSRLADEGGHR